MPTKDILVLEALIRECNEISHAHGWWEGENYIEAGPKKIALMHSELSEALEAMRVNNYTGKDSVCEELADTIIRIFDYAAEARLPLAEEILAKMERNRTRPYKHGGKAF